MNQIQAHSMDLKKVLQNTLGAIMVVLLASFVGVGQTLAQSTYYVNGNGPGNDAFDGSQMSVGLFPAGPFATITAALTAATADGDKVVVLSGNYNANGILADTKNVSILVRTSGGNVNVLVAGFNAVTATKTLTLGVETAASGGTFVTDGAGVDIALTTGGINITGAVTIGAGGTVTRQNGTLTGTAPTATNYNVMFGAPGAAIAANTTAGNEVLASLGTGTLTFMHTGALVTLPNTVSAATITSTSAGNVTFGANATASAAAAGAFNVSGGATVTVSGSLTASNAAGGITISGASKLTAGATTVAGAPFAHAGTGGVTVASLSLPGNGSVLTVSSTGAFTSAGTVTAGGTVGRTIVDNTGTAIVTLGAVTTGAPFVDVPAAQIDITSVIDNGSTGRIMIVGAITEGSIADVQPGADDTEYHAISLTNAANGRISIGASSTIRGNILNSETDAGVDGHGILLGASATLTVNPIGAVIGGFGDFVGGTLAIAYAAGSTDATVGGAIGGAVTDANNVTFTSAVTTNAAAGILGTVGNPIEGNVRLQEATHTWNTAFQVLGTLFIEANAQTISGVPANSFGGLTVGSTTGSSFTGGAVTVTGTTATLGNTDFTSAFAAATADVTSTAGATFTASFGGKSLSVSGAGAVAIGTTINTTGNVTIAAGTTLTLTAPAAASDMGGAVDVNGMLAVVGASTIGIGSMDIDPTTGLASTAGATVWNFDGSGFVGGTYTDNGGGDTFNFAIPSTGATVSVKPGTTWGALGVTGSGRTITFTESVNIAGNVTIGNDATLALGTNSIVMNGIGGVLTLTDEAAITNTGTNGSIQFVAIGQRITVAGAPNTTPSLTNLIVNNGAGSALTIDEPINIAGTLALLDGGVIIDGAQVIGAPYTGVAGPNAGAAAVTFTGANGKIARTFPNEGITLTSGSVAGTYDLNANGTLGTFGAEYAATQIRNLTIATTGITTFPATVASITGNFSVTNAGGQATMGAANLTVAGNVTATGDILVPATRTLAFSGVFTSANNATGGNILSTGTLRFSGANMTHTLGGEIFATSRFSAAGITVNGSVAAGDADGDSEFGAILSDAASSATLANVQDINGTVTVSGTLTVTLVRDAVGGADVDGQIAGVIDINNGGSMTLTGVTVAATNSFLANLLVNDGGTFTAGSTLISSAGGDFIIGDGSQAAAATFNLNGQTVTANGSAGSVTVVASTGATAPSFGTSGTLIISAGGQILGATNPTVPNLTINGGALAEIDSDVTVTGTFTVAAASNGANGDNVTLSGSGAVGQFNAAYTATMGDAGSQIITTGTTIQTTLAAVAITNLWVNSTSTTTMMRSTAGFTTFTVNHLNHDQGVLDITNETFVMAGDGSAATVDWDHDGGTYAGTGFYTITNGAVEVDLDANNTTISIPNLAVNNATPMGLQLGSSDGLTVTGTLTLNGGAGNVQTENGASDATFSVANGATIIRSTGGATNHFDNTPTLGTGLTVRYTSNTAGVVSSAELPSTLNRLEWEGTGGASNFQLADNRAITVNWLESSAQFSIDEDDDGNNSVTITAGGTMDFDGNSANFQDIGSANTDESFTAAGAITILFNNVTFGTSDDHWPNAVTGSTVTIQVNGAGNTVTLHENKSAGAVTVGDGAGGSATLAVAATTLSATSLTVAVDGIVTSTTGAVNVSGALANTGALTSNVLAQGSVTLTGATAATNPGSLTLNGTTAQVLNIPAGGSVVTLLVVNNAMGATVSGGNLALGLNTIVGGVVTVAGSGLTLTNGTLNLGTSTLFLSHGGSGQQGFTRTGGCVFGNVRKDLSNTTATAPADRMEFPLCSSGGVYRPYAITFNNPNTIGGVAPSATPSASAAPAITIRHDVGGESGAVDITGTNGLPVIANGVNVARYPVLNSFFWTVSPSFTMSPSLNYDVDMRANDYANFSSSCGTTACDINEIFPIRRHVGSDNNLWAVASSNINNFLAGADDPVVVGTGATGTLQTSGTVFTYGLKSIFAAGAATTVNVATAGTHAFSANSLFTGFQGNVASVAISGGGTTASGAAAGTPSTITVTGGATVGATTLTVTAQDSFGASATATITVNNAAALTVAAAQANKTINVTNTFDVTFASVFSGGSGTVAYTAASSGASATVANTATTTTVTGAAAGGPDTITLSATDGSSTPVTVTSTFTVTVNASVAAAGALANQTVTDAATVTQDISAQFSGGTVAGSYAVTVASATETTATVAVSGNTVTVTGQSPYAVVGGAITDTTPVTITVTGTDDLGSSASTTYTVDVNAVKGDVDGDADADIFDAVAVLDFAVGIGTPTTKQFAAADYNSNGTIQAFDAFAIFNASTPKREIAANVVADLGWGDVTRTDMTAELPVTLTGDVSAAVAAQLWTSVDPEVAKVTGVTFLVEDAVATAYHVTEDGEITLAVIGGYVPSDGIIATISLELLDSSAEFQMSARGSVNDNVASDIDDLDVAELPETFALLGNYPNPFNPSTTIQFDLPETSEVSIEIFDMLGRRVLALPAQTMQAGAKRSLQLNGSALASGSYFYRVIARTESSTMVDSGRMLLVK